MAWEKVSPEIVARLEQALEGYEKRLKPMFGCPAYFINDTWFAGAWQDVILVRLNQEQQAELLADHPDARRFEPFEGRVMKEFMVLPPAVSGDDKLLDLWLTEAHLYSASLPPKPRKKKKPRPKMAAKAGKP